jgi:hypothetical protein
VVPSPVIERGDIQAFFRPTVQPAAADTARLGVQALFLVLSPAGGPHRRVRIGKKRFPSSGERLWARVERVGSFEQVMGGMLEDEHYSTKTRGDRYQPAARPVAFGTYELVQHEDHTHLVIDFDAAEPVPDELVVVPEHADMVVLFENTSPTRAVWTTAGEPSRLDHEGEELVLVGHDHATWQ